MLTSAPSPWLPFFWFRWEKAVRGNLEHTRECQKLIVSYAPESRFDLRQCAPADVQSGQLAPGGKFLLGQAKIIAPGADLWPNEVGGFFGSGHALEK